MICSLKLLVADKTNNYFVSTKDCPLARALNRRFKTGYYAVCGSTNYDIYFNGKLFRENIEIPTTWRCGRFDSMTKNIVIKIEIPNECLKRVHKPRAERKTNTIGVKKLEGQYLVGIIEQCDIDKAVRNNIYECVMVQYFRRMYAHNDVGCGMVRANLYANSSHTRIKRSFLFNDDGIQITRDFDAGRPIVAGTRFTYREISVQ